MEVHRLLPEEWRALSENAHLISFQERKPADWDRIDYALFVVDDKKPVGYITCREWDKHTVYWQFGGTFPGTLGTANSFRAYSSCIDWAKVRYRKVTTLIENTNIPMLKMAMKVGFRVIGVRNFQGSILLEHLLEF